jgi:hypothetical protein
MDGTGRGRRAAALTASCRSARASQRRECARAVRRSRYRCRSFKALDQATGYLMAAAAISGLAGRLVSGAGAEAHLSLARTAKLLIDQSAAGAEPPFAAETEADWSPAVERVHRDRRGGFVRRPKLPAYPWSGPIQPRDDRAALDVMSVAGDITRRDITPFLRRAG